MFTKLNSPDEPVSSGLILQQPLQGINVLAFGVL